MGLKSLLRLPSQNTLQTAYFNVRIEITKNIPKGGELSMLLKSNAQSVRLSGGTLIKRTNNGYQKVRADIIYENNIITEIIENPNSSTSNDMLTIQLREDELILPGLIDLHNHFDYNMMPLWPLLDKCQGKYWDIRHQWRNCDDYNKDIKKFRSYLESSWQKKYDAGETKADFNTAFQFFSELQALAGGTTVLQESNTILYNDPNKSDYIATHLLLRSTGVAADLGLNSEKELISIIDFVKPYINEAGKVEIPPDEVYPCVDTTNWPLSETKDFEDFLKAVKNQSYTQQGGYLVHLAEGRSGGFNKYGDPCTRNEFELFKKRLKEIDPDGSIVRKFKVALIHGCGINFDEAFEENKKFLLDYGIGLIWSPVSNLLLYGRTPDFFNKLYYTSYPLSLGSDWAPSGSKHVWDEAYFAYDYLKLTNSDDELLLDKVLDMVTVNPATTIGASKIGEIKVGAFADFFILSQHRDALLAKSQLDGLFNFTDVDTKAVIINGNIMYGDRYVFDQFQIDEADFAYMPLSDGIYAKNKCVRIPPESKINFDNDLALLDELFNDYHEGSTEMIRSKFLSQNDREYLNVIGDLKEKFCTEVYTEIYTKDDFYKIKNNPSGNYRLMRSIELDPIYFKGDNNFDFSGVLDGQNYEIKVTSGPLFATVSNCVRNLTLTGSVNTSEDEFAILTRNNRGHINNCCNNVSIKNNDRTGGLVFYNYRCIEKCINKKTIIGGWCVGGICTINIGYISNCSNLAPITEKNLMPPYIVGNTSADLKQLDFFSSLPKDYPVPYHVGGICGTSKSAKIQNCYNKGSISAQSVHYATTSIPNKAASGICGISIDTSITFCYNFGGISGYTASGICGYSYNGSIASCYNRADIISEHHAGGLCGIGIGNTNITDCYNAAGIISLGFNSHAGLRGDIVGILSGGSIRNCYYDSSISFTDTVTGIRKQSYPNAGKTTSQMTNKNFVSLLNADDFTMPKYEDGTYYPELKVFSESTNSTVRDHSKQSAKTS